MNFQLGAMVAGGAFVLSFLAGLIGGVPFFDIFLRALIWAVVGFGASLGIESLLRSLLPDLFSPAEEAAEPESASGQSVNITLEEEAPRGGFVEEVDESEPARPRPSPSTAPAPETLDAQEPAPQAASQAPASDSDEEMPEIGSFLDAFKPESEAGEEGAAAAPEIGEYTPVESGHRSSSGEVTIDGEVQDPVILAKAVQTVLKRDGQGT